MIHRSAMSNYKLVKDTLKRAFARINISFHNWNWASKPRKKYNKAEGIVKNP
jgi:hypothetical protein